MNYNGVVTGLSFLSNDCSFCLCFSLQHFQLKEDSDIWVGLGSFRKKRECFNFKKMFCVRGIGILLLIMFLGVLGFFFWEGGGCLIVIFLCASVLFYASVA